MPDEFPDPPTEPASVSPDELARMIAAAKPIRLLDVRNRDEFETWHVSGSSVTATQIPFSKALQAQVTDSVPDLAEHVDGEGPITVVCGRGESSAYVAGLFEDHGIEAHNLADGMRGWARVYEAYEIETERATVLQYQRPSSGCLGYAIISDGTAAVVDPLRTVTGRYSDDAAARDATVEYVIDTHIHADHVSGLRTVADATGGAPLISGRARERDVAFEVGTVADDGTRSVGETTLRTVPLPGHTTGMTGVAVDDVLLTGDSLFIESVARPDLEAGDDGAPELANELYTTLTERLAAFDDETVIAPGHVGERTPRNDDGSYTATLGALRENLWAFDVDREAFVERILSDMPPRPANFEAIMAANLGETDPSEETAFEWELGPNNCAATAD
ncbi:MBL fold metallo-hydrolase [Halobacteriales archaeon QS_4_62_28]|nr:MAG: MBL fold metallo-hydrolase [Halobacteriales archaeon QS_4_62_28]